MLSNLGFAALVVFGLGTHHAAAMPLSLSISQPSANATGSSMSIVAFTSASLVPAVAATSWNTQFPAVSQDLVFASNSSTSKFAFTFASLLPAVATSQPLTKASSSSTTSQPLTTASSSSTTSQPLTKASSSSTRIPASKTSYHNAKPTHMKENEYQHRWEILPKCTYEIGARIVRLRHIPAMNPRDLKKQAPGSSGYHFKKGTPPEDWPNETAKLIGGYLYKCGKVTDNSDSREPRPPFAGTIDFEIKDAESFQCVVDAYQAATDHRTECLPASIANTTPNYDTDHPKWLGINNR